MSEQEEKESKTVEYIFKIAVLAITLWAIPITKTVYNNHAELYVGPRFTAQQGAQVEQRLGLVEHKVDSLEIPPPWLLDMVKKLETKVDKNHDLIVEMKADLKSIKHQVN